MHVHIEFWFKFVTKLLGRSIKVFQKVVKSIFVQFNKFVSNSSNEGHMCCSSRASSVCEYKYLLKN
jgi:hypothetical protein